MPEAVTTALTTGSTAILATVTAVVVMIVPAAISVMSIKKGAKFGLKWLGGLFHS